MSRTIRALASMLCAATAAAFLAASLARAAEPLPGADVALMLAVDVSSSVDDEERRFQRIAYARALRDPGVARAAFSGEHQRIVVGYMEWSGPHFQNVIVPLRAINSPDELHVFADEIEAVASDGLALNGHGYNVYSGTTAMGNALLRAAELLAPFQGLAKSTVVDISADGINNDGTMIEEARDHLLAQGLTINGLPIALGETVVAGLNTTITDRDSQLEAYFAHCVVGGPGAFHVLAQGWADVEHALRAKLIMELAGGPAVLPGQKKPVSDTQRTMPANFQIDMNTKAQKAAKRVDCASGMITSSRSE